MTGERPLALATRIDRIQPSPTVAIMGEALRLKAEGVDITDFSAGQPDFPTPEPIRQAGIRAIQDGHTRYTANAGTTELRAAVATRYREDYGLEFAPEGVIITSGGKHALLGLMLSLVDAADEVIIPTPYWATFAEQVRLAGGTPVLVQTDVANGFRITADRIAPVLTEKTRMLLLNFPANPTGAVIGGDTIRALVDLIADRDTVLLWDDTYARLMFEPAPNDAFRYAQERLGGRFVVAGTASKAYAMTGWRIGWALGPEPLIRACSALQSHMTSNASSVSQMAAIEALAGDQAPLAGMIAEYRSRAERMHAGLLALGLEAAMPGGGFYLFPDVSEKLLPGETSADFARALLDEARVAVVPGSAFGCEGHVRMSFACAREVIDEGLGRIEAFLAERAEREAP